MAEMPGEASLLSGMSPDVGQFPGMKRITSSQRPPSVAKSYCFGVRECSAFWAPVCGMTARRGVLGNKKNWESSKGVYDRYEYTLFEYVSIIV